MVNKNKSMRGRQAEPQSAASSADTGDTLIWPASPAESPAPTDSDILGESEFDPDISTASGHTTPIGKWAHNLSQSHTDVFRTRDDSLY
jgi:hypothetical protein